MTMRKLQCILGVLILFSGFFGCSSHRPKAVPQPAADPWKDRSDLIKTPLPAKPGQVNLPAVVHEVLSNGLKIRVISDRTWPLIDLHLVLPGSTLNETRPLRSLASFAAQMMLKGTKRLSADQIAETIDTAGGSLRAWADQDGTHVTCQVLSHELPTCLKLISEIVMQPTFPGKEMAQVRDELITVVKQVRDNDRQLAEEHFQNLLWGDDHVRGWPITIQTVSAITRNDLIAWHATHAAPNGAVLAVAGDIDSKTARQQLQKAFGGWRVKKLHPPARYAPPAVQGIHIRLVDKPDQTQSRIIIGHVGIAHADPDFLSTSLMNYSLGGGLFSSRLMKVIRSEGGKTYGASSRFESEAAIGTFEVRTFTRNAETLATVKLVLNEINKMHASGPTAEELADAQANMAGKYPSMFEMAGSVAAAFLEAELHGLSEESVRAYPVKISEVTLEQVVASAANHLSDANQCMVIVGKAADVEPQLQSAGMAYEKVGYLEPTSTLDRPGK